ncbi:hypothetical protein M422DRAFT_254694 [Sphaerobolus stellatus SS14]|uniref:Unplaced genomic scaffold SPHSTscaffold_56, whole genome shotgun sequence n=1 Tax=Sphaerobolus stellatus (strain SS14) TaxID=990650 RepID=A0A0C9V5S8_SPHS4|nr:hypothetical protein M422DRAFT_254694 [Sphaerobolus stellatus SS14]
MIRLFGFLRHDKNRITIQLANKDKELAAATNRDDSAEVSMRPSGKTPPQRSQLKPQHIADATQRSRIVQAAHKFTYMNMLWLRDSEEVFGLQVDPDYIPANRFKSMEEKCQGILAELREEIPAKWHDEISNVMVIHTFNEEMTQMRSNGSHRVREVGPFIFNCSNNLFYDDEQRTTKFKEDIGFVVNEEGDKWKMFRNPALMKTYSALVRGVKSIQGLSPDEITKPAAKSTVETKWRVRSITPVAIAMAAVYTRFAASNDRSFQAVGSQTGIGYQEDYEYYLKYLYEGLRLEVPSVQDIFEVWNDIFYPKRSEAPKTISGSVDEDLDGFLNDLHAEADEARVKQQQNEQVSDEDHMEHSPSWRESRPCSRELTEPQMSKQNLPSNARPHQSRSSLRSSSLLMDLEGSPSSRCHRTTRNEGGKNSKKKSVPKKRKAAKIVESSEDENIPPQPKQR